MNIWKPKQEALGAISDRQIAGLRFFLSAVALLAIYLNPSEPDRFVPLTYTALLVYNLYSGLVYVAARHWERFSTTANAALVGADMLIYSLLITLSSGTNSVFFSFYLFVVLVACSRLGAAAGVVVTVFSTVLYITLGSLATQGTVEWNRIFLRSATLMVLGYVLTYWARAELCLRKKLELLREVSLTSNPRFGVDRTAGHFMERVLTFFRAETCILLEDHGHTGRNQLRCATNRDPKGGVRLIPVPEKLDLLPTAKGSVALYLGPRQETYRVWDPINSVVTTRPVEEIAQLAEWLGGKSFVAVPLRHHEWCRGYLFVSTARRGAFRLDDAKFLLQVADQVTSVLEHIRLVDCMATDAADEERRRIARSVHDRVIQPYIGVQMGLLGVRRLVQSVLQDIGDYKKAEQGREALEALEQLVHIARDGVEELREYVYGLRQTKARGDLLIESLLRYSAKFEIVTGIRVTVVNRINFQDINDRLASEIFQMATEALSNVHRHTTATAVRLTVSCSPHGNVVVGIENEAPAEMTNRDFLPRSIAERAESLGGSTEVSTKEGRTVVKIEIPL
jgi:signal transduction histidine kinase